MKPLRYLIGFGAAYFFLFPAICQEPIKRNLEAFFSFAQKEKKIVIRQNQFVLNVQQGRIDCVELWVVPSKNFVLVKMGHLGADSIESFQNGGITQSKLDNLENKIALLNNHLFVNQPLRNSWLEVEKRAVSLGYSDEIQLDISSYANYYLKVNYWSNLLTKFPKNPEALASLERLKPKNGIIDYKDESSKSEIKLWLADDGRCLLRAQTLQDGIVFSEVQNTFFNEIPSEIINLISKLENLKGSSENEPWLTRLRGRKALGLFLSDSNLRNDGYREILWIAKNGPAADAGLKEGDIVIKINGIDIRPLTKVQLQDLLARSDEFIFSIKRDGKELEIQNVVKKILK